MGDATRGLHEYHGIKPFSFYVPASCRARRLSAVRDWYKFAVTMGDPADTLTPLTLDAMQRLYDQGQVLQAYRLGIAEKPIDRWQGCETLILGGRIMGNLAAQRLGRRMHLCAMRQNPDDVKAAYYGAFAVAERQGPLAAIALFTQWKDRLEGESEIRADWLALRASLAAIYRDFDTADDLIAEAEQLAPHKPWIAVERCDILEKQDRYDEALAAAKYSLQLQPWYRPGVRAVAHLLQLLDRDDQAVNLLTEAADHIQSAPVLLQLASLQDHLRLHQDALRTLDRLDGYVPIVEKPFAQWLAYLRSNIAYHDGDIQGAIGFAEKAKTPLMSKVAEQLRRHTDQNIVSPRVSLSLPFVRQHHMTCAPATLTAISRYWDRPADHLAVVDAICYDGTSNYSQRKWAREAGWLTREFSVTWDVAVALIDRGIPFTLATTSASAGHLQAVIGYDRLRGTLLCRDPYQYYLSEISVELLQEFNAARGPRGMLMLPPDQSHRLDQLILPDSELFDHLHNLEHALQQHDRVAAEASLEQLTATAPTNRLTQQGRLMLAGYDSNPAATLDAAEQILSLHPNDQPTLLIKASALRRLDRHDLLRPLLRELTAKRNCDTVFLNFLADDLRQEIGTAPAVMELLRKSLRQTPTHAQSLIGMANILWDRRRLEEATDLYFMAACLDDKNESAADSYFLASRHLRRTQHGLDMLRRRFERFGSKSHGPAITLYWALERLNQDPEALAMLDQACALRPDDGELMLFSADAYARRNDTDKVRHLLDAAQGKSHPTALLRCSAKIANYQGDHTTALQHWRQVLETEPDAYDAHESISQLLAETQSHDAVDQHLLNMQQRFPHNNRLQRLRIIWLRSRGAAAVVPAATELVERQPGDMWARCELSLNLEKLGQAEAALEHANAALAIDPQSTTAHNARGVALQLLHRPGDARAAFKRAIEISVDYHHALQNLIDSYSDRNQKREALAFVHAELVRQVIFGDSLLTYRDLAADLLEPAELLESLEQAKAARPDLWQTWSAVVQQLSDLNRLADALAIAQAATERFPLLPRTWFDLARVQGLMDDRPGQIESLTHCLQLSPGWSWAARTLSAALEHPNESEKARAVLVQAIARDPLSAQNHEALARLLWTANEKQQAIEHIRRAVLLNPADDSAWDSFRQWSDSLGQQSEFVAFARDMCQRRSGEAASWLVLARVLDGKDTIDERLQAVKKAIGIAPHNVDAHDLHACLLLEAGRRDDALAACNPPEFGETAPLYLRGRRAWILAQRKEDIPAAINEIGELLRDNHTYYWGWLQLMRWISKQDRAEEYRVAAESMATFFPHDVVAHNYHADALLACGERAAAITTLQRSLAISPTDHYAIRHLMRTQLETAQWTEADSTLNHAKTHLPGTFAYLMEVFLATKRANRKRALMAFTELLDAEPEQWAVDEALEALDPVVKKSRSTRVMGQLVQRNPSVSEFIVNKWATRAAGANRFGTIQKFLRNSAVPKAQWSTVAVVYLNRLALTKRKVLVQRLVRKHRRRLRADTLAWGTTGFTLFSCGQSGRTIKWLRGYTEYPDARPWMVLNLATALHRRSRPSKAVPVHQWAMQLKADHTTNNHRVWLAFEDAVAGHNGEYLRQVQQHRPQDLDKHYPFILALTDALAPLVQPGAAKDPAAIKLARQRLAVAVMAHRKFLKKQREVRHSVRRAARRIAAVRPTVRARLWAGTWAIRARLAI